MLLIDTEPTNKVQLLMQNARELYQQFCEIARVPRYDLYKLFITFPEIRTDLVKAAPNMEPEIEKTGMQCRMYGVRDADMLLVKGKAGLLACSLWGIAGAILINDEPIPVESAGSILSLANHTQGIHAIGKGRNAALIGSTASIGPSIRRLSPQHKLSELLDVLSAGTNIGQSRRPAKWWRFWA
jgi:hypothetical protein